GCYIRGDSMAKNGMKNTLVTVKHMVKQRLPRLLPVLGSSTPEQATVGRKSSLDTQSEKTRTMKRNMIHVNWCFLPLPGGESSRPTEKRCRAQLKPQTCIILRLSGQQQR